MVGGKFNKDKLMKNLQLVMARVDVLKKKTNAVKKRNMTGVAELLADRQFDSAFLKAESMCREDYLMEALERLSNYCEVLLSRMSLFVSTAGCEESLLDAVSMILWSTPKVNLRLPEMQVIFGELRKKLGEPFVKSKVDMDVLLINKKFYTGITCQNPRYKVMDSYLHSIAKTYNVEYCTPIDVVEKIQLECKVKENTLNVSVEVGLTLEQMARKDEEEQEEERRKKKNFLVKKFSREKKKTNDGANAQPIFYPSGDRAVNDSNAAENLGPPIVTSVNAFSPDDLLFNERIKNSAKTKEYEEAIDSPVSSKVASPVAQPPGYDEDLNLVASPYNPFMNVDPVGARQITPQNDNNSDKLLEDDSDVDMELFAKNLKSFYPDKN